jgi:hypothetical protein
LFVSFPWQFLATAFDIRPSSGLARMPEYFAIAQSATRAALKPAPQRGAGFLVVALEYGKHPVRFEHSRTA